MIDVFISEAAGRFGIDPSTARALTGGVLKLIKKEAPAEDFEAVADQVPGTEAVVAESDQPAADEGGLLGGLGGGLGGGFGGVLGAAASALGGGDVASLMSLFGESGLGADQAGQFVQMLVGFLKDKVGPELVQKIVAQVPALSSLLS